MFPTLPSTKHINVITSLYNKNAKLEIIVIQKRYPMSNSLYKQRGIKLFRHTLEQKPNVPHLHLFRE